LKASIIIPTLSAGPGFEKLLEKLSAQETDFDYEILVLDSGSTDGTVELARRYGAFVHRIPRTQFNHGATRNLGISFSKGEYVALIVQDALPLDERWLAAMVENLDRARNVAGVYGRQVPHPQSSLLTRALVNGWPTAELQRREQYVEDPALYSQMTPTERRSLAVFDNVSSCVRRSVWEDISFERVPFGEDLRWGKSVVEAGYKIVYEPRSAVYHSHERGSLYDLRRHYVEGKLLLDLFGLASTPNLAALLFNVLRFSVRLYRLLRREKEISVGALRFAPLAARYALFSQIGAYLAAKNRLLARAYPKLSAGLDRLVGY
jgi:rhamnosyltransferase